MRAPGGARPMDAPVLKRRLDQPVPLRPAGSVTLPLPTEPLAIESRLRQAGGLPALRRLVEEATLDDVASAVRFRREGYARVPLARTEDAELLVMGWLPGQRTPVHDHGLSHGFIKVLAGEGSDDSFALLGERAVLVQRRGFATGMVLEERPDQVHRLTNDSSNVLITLHAYSPALEGVRTYAE